MLRIYSFIFSLLWTVESARILVVVPTPSISHQVVFRPLTQELAKRGHQVTIITTDPVFPKNQAPENLTEIDLHDISYATWRKTILTGSVTSGNQNDVFTQIKTFLPLMTYVYEQQIKVPEVENIITNRTQYDLLILEAWVRPAMMFVHLNKNAPVILFSSFGGLAGNYDTIGAPSRPALLYPTLLRQRIVNLSLYEKLTELYNHYLIESLFLAEDVAVNKLLKKLIGDDTPSLHELDNRVDMMFLNFYPIWDFNRPVPPSVVYMGGLHQNPTKDLPKNLKHNDSISPRLFANKSVIGQSFEGEMSAVDLISTVESARILAVLPTPSISHQVVFRPLTQELAKRGHQITIITTDPVFPKEQAPENLTEIDVHNISYKIWREVTSKISITNGNKNDVFLQINTLLPLMRSVYKQQMKVPEVKDIIKNRKQFDLLILEAWVRPAMMFAHLNKNAVVVLVSSFGAFGGNFDTIGAPGEPAILYPSLLQQRLVNPTLLERLTELYKHYLFKSRFSAGDVIVDKLIKKLIGDDTVSLHELDDRVDMMFLNFRPIWDYNRPVPPSVVYMGSLHQQPTKKLPKDLKQYLDSSKHGVIYISYGTNVSPSQLPPEKIQILTRAFSKLPYDVLWKWDKDVLPGQASNIRISNWLPQSDLLKHPKIKLFITQGGLQSTDEAITAGVPLIGMPMLGDQWYNVEQYVRHKVGLRIDMDTLTEEGFLKAVHTVIDDNSYRKNIEKLRSLMHDQPQTALERSVWWVEHLLRHGGGRHLRAPAANMTWSEYLDLELMAALAAIALSILAVIVVSSYSVFRVVRNYLVASKKLKKS